MAEMVHRAGGKIGVQLAHAGRLCKNPPGVGASNHSLRSGDREVAACIPADDAVMDRVINAFAAAAHRAKQAGFDCVQLHMAHGYFLSQWLSPLFNKREDQHSGSIENRLRFPLRVVAAVRTIVGADFPILVKLNVSDFHDDGLTLVDSTAVVLALARAGVCLVEASGGTPLSRFVPIRRGSESTEGYHRDGAAAWSAALRASGLSAQTRVAIVGGVRAAATAQRLIDDGVCDVVSMARPFIRQPDLVALWEKTPDLAKAECISCSRCFEPIRRGEGLFCPVKHALLAKAKQVAQ
eukprot:TRINITY_DN2023_c0_g1_i2.p1 TRINITY_DN2023_c0_g1~~TRINITY_DN2023_c0_g1_i2.p1  ORF type:complete len:335 (+),score=68.95 TRINITY_DN2023_c0_g1_i2:123-1007(+)